MKSSVIILTAYPISSHHLIDIKKKLGHDFDRITLAELGQYGGIRLLKMLRSIRHSTLLLPIEDESSAVLLPIVKLVAGFTSAKSINVVHPGWELKPVTTVSIIWDIFRLCFASLASMMSAILSLIELNQLLIKPRIGFSLIEKKKGILYLKTNLWFGVKAGGSVGHIAGVVNAFQHKGIPVTFVSAEHPAMVDSKVEVRKIQAPRTFGTPYELNNYRFQRRFAHEANQFIVEKKYSFIYQRLSAANYLGVKLSRDAQLPLIVEYNCSEVWASKNWGKAMRFHSLAAKAEEVMLRHAHLVVTISEVLKDELIARGIDRSRIVCYPNCIDPELFHPQRFTQAERDALRRRYGILPPATVVGFIGTFGQWHGAEVLARAIALLHSQDGEWLSRYKVHFLLVGDGLRMQQVRNIIRQSGVDAICTFTGLVPQEQAALHLSAADILASPHVHNSDGSRFFGSPTKLFEYMAMEKGIIASNLDQIGEVLSPGVDARDLPDELPGENSQQLAVLCEPGNVEDLVKGLKFLVERCDWRMRLARNARFRALEKYTWHHHVEAILQCL